MWTATHSHEVGTGVAGRHLACLEGTDLVRARLRRDPSGCPVVDVVADLDTIDPGLAQTSFGQGRHGDRGVALAGVSAVNPVADLEHVRSPTRHESARTHDIVPAREHGVAEVLTAVPFAARLHEVAGRGFKIVLCARPGHEWHQLRKRLVDRLSRSSARSTAHRCSVIGPALMVSGISGLFGILTDLSTTSSRTRS